MRKRGRKKKEKTRKIEGLGLEEPEEANLILSALRDALQPHLSLRWEAIRRDRILGFVTGVNGSPVQSLETRETAFPFLSLADWQYWISAKLQFEPAGDQLSFLSVSLTIFRSNGFASSKQALLRAEWERPREDQLHAQPHWHVHPPMRDRAASSSWTREARPARSLLDEEVPEPAGPMEERRQFSFDRFHFAMAARWHDNEPDSHCTPPDSGSVANWLKHCIVYIRNEINSLSRG